MIPHQYEGVNLNQVPFRDFTQQPQKMKVIAPIVKYPPPVNPAIDHMIPSIPDIHPQWSAHARITPQIPLSRQCYM